MRILETIKTAIKTARHTGNVVPTQDYLNLKETHTYQIDLKNQEIQKHKEAIQELRKTITTLGTKDQERTQEIQKLTTLLATANNKIATMRTDLETQVQFMQVTNTAIHTMLQALTKLPDQMPSLAPDFHPLSTLENPPYRETTQEIQEQLTNTQEPTKHYINDYHKPYNYDDPN